MPNIRFRLLIVLAALGLTPPVLAADTYEVDPVHSSVIFRVQHLGVSYFYGRFVHPEGQFTYDSGDPSACAFQVQLKAEHIDTANEARDKHLRGGDFFNAQQFPLIEFKSTSVKALDSNRFEVAGTLDLHGVSRPMSVTLTRTGEGQTMRGGQIMGFETTFTIKRSDFDMKFMLDKLGDEVTLMVSLEGARK